MEGLLYSIEESFKTLSPQNKKIAKYILQNPESIIWLSIKEFSQKAEVSPAAISRFCRTLYLKGFSELKITLSQELIKYKATTNNDIDEESFKQNIPRQLFEKDFSALNDTLTLLKPEKLIAAAHLINQSENILCSGIGASGLVAQDMLQKLLRIQKKACYFEDIDLKKIILSQYTPKDLVFLVSYSGKKEATLSLARLAKERNIPIISLTRVGNTPLSRLSTINFEAASFEDEYRTSAVSSRLAHLYLVDTIFYTYGLHFQAQAFEKLRITYELINK